MKASVMSEFCGTGEVAVCAVLSFSFFRHLARRFWNQTLERERERKGGGEYQRVIIATSRPHTCTRASVRSTRLANSSLVKTSG